jgi:hypothetical protein
MSLPQDNRIDVTGEEEVNRALEKVRKFDIAAARSRAINALLPTVASNTRRETGAMAAQWVEQNQAFVNTASYSVVQEFGGMWIEPTYAVFSAWDANHEAIINAFNTEIDSAADQAGFDT